MGWSQLPIIQAGGFSPESQMTGMWSKHHTMANPWHPAKMLATMENHHAINGNIHYFYGHFQVRKLLVYQRVIPPFSYAFPMGFPIKTSIFLCFSYGFPIKTSIFLCFSYGFPIKTSIFLCFSYGFPIKTFIFLCFSYGFPIKTSIFLCFSYGFSH